MLLDLAFPGSHTLAKGGVTSLFLFTETLIRDDSQLFQPLKSCLMATSFVRPIVINWHLTEACNYKCKYCYAAWSKADHSRAVAKDADTSFNLMKEISTFFHPENIANPLRSKMNWDGVRLNLAGGEPFLFGEKVVDISRMAHDLGMEVSIITNGSLITYPVLRELAPFLSWIGFSIDSSNPETNLRIGRNGKRNSLLDIGSLGKALSDARSINPGLKTKVNTVINKFNHHEFLTPVIESIFPERWKVLRALPVVNDELGVTDNQFHDFVSRHDSLRGIMVVEDHADMRESYIMIDPHGRFFQNGLTEAGAGYVYSQPIPLVGAAQAFSEMTFNSERFSSRYTNGSTSKFRHIPITPSQG